MDEEARPRAGKGMAGPVYVSSHTISVRADGDRKRERSPSEASMFDHSAHNLEQFLYAASSEFALLVVSEYNEEFKCSCFSCCANKFNFADLENPVNCECKLRLAIIERLKDNNCEMYNLLDNLGVVHRARLMFKKADASNGVDTDETYPDIDAHVVEFYRVPGADETFHQYVESENYWKLIGFAKRICDCETVDDSGIIQWRDFILHLYEVRKTPYIMRTYNLLKALTRVLWPEWKPPNDN
jgi:hypothetical protein